MSSLEGDWELVDNPWKARQETLSPSVNDTESIGETEQLDAWSQDEFVIPTPDGNDAKRHITLGEPTLRVSDTWATEEEGSVPTTSYFSLDAVGACRSTKAWDDGEVRCHSTRTTAVAANRHDPDNHDSIKSIQTGQNNKSDVNITLGQIKPIRWDDEDRRWDRYPKTPSSILLSPPISAQLGPPHHPDGLSLWLLNEQLLAGFSEEDPWAQRLARPSEPGDEVSSILLQTEVIDRPAPLSITLAPRQAGEREGVDPRVAPKSALVDEQQQISAPRSYQSGSQIGSPVEQRYDLPPDMLQAQRPLPTSCQCGHKCPIEKGEQTCEELEKERRKTQRRRRRKYVDILSDQRYDHGLSCPV